MYVNGSWPIGEIDHVNGDRGDNRIANLRDVDHKTNSQNERRARAINTSGFLGVSKQGNKWQASIRHGGKQLYLGLFAAKEEAHSAYLAAKRLLHAGNTL